MVSVPSVSVLPGWWPWVLVAVLAAGVLGSAAAAAGFGPAYWRADSPELRRSIRMAARMRIGWTRLARQSGLRLVDDTPTVADRWEGRNRAKAGRARVQLPPLLSITPRQMGVVCEFGTLPTVGKRQFDAAADDLINKWRAARVTIRQPRAGVVRVTALHTDPLTRRTEATVPPRPKVLDRLQLGTDEDANDVFLQLANSSGVGIFGSPGFGKSMCIRWLLTRLAPSRAAQFIVLDGKTATGMEGDYAELAPRVTALVGDDMDTAAALLEQLVAERRRRSSAIREQLGVTNLWDVGPSEKWPMLMVIVDEAHTYCQGKSAQAARIVTALEDLAKKGRSVGIVLVLGTQKGTADALPTAIRDMLTASICFAVRTLPAAIAALGPSITDYPDTNPVTFLRDECRGVAAMAAEGMPGFVRLRVPYTPADLAEAVATATAHYVSLAVLPTVTVGTGHHRRTPTAPPAPPTGGGRGPRRTTPPSAKSTTKSRSRPAAATRRRPPPV